MLTYERIFILIIVPNWLLINLVSRIIFINISLNFLRTINHFDLKWMEFISLNWNIIVKVKGRNWAQRLIMRISGCDALIWTNFICDPWKTSSIIFYISFMHLVIKLVFKVIISCQILRKMFLLNCFFINHFRIHDSILMCCSSILLHLLIRSYVWEIWLMIAFLLSFLLMQRYFLALTLG